MIDKHTSGQLQRAEKEDCKLLFDWRNNEAVRKMAINQEPLVWKCHCLWWQNTLLRKDSIYNLYYENKEPLGMVALTEISQKHSRCSWSFYTGPNSPKGTGKKMLRAAQIFVFENLGLNKLTAEVLAFNAKSIALHKKLGFVTEGLQKHHYKIGCIQEDVYLFACYQKKFVSDFKN